MILSHAGSFSSRKTFTKRSCCITTAEGAQPVVLENFVRKLIIQDFSLDINLSPVSSVNIAFDAVNALKKIEINDGCVKIQQMNNFRTVKVKTSNIVDNLLKSFIAGLNMLSIRGNAK